MEIFNNIWTALSTPNEGLVNILLFPTTFLESFLGMLLFLNVLKIPANNVQKIIYVILSSLSGQISTHFIPLPYNIILNYVLLFIIIFNLFKTNILKTILAVILPTACFALLSALVLNPFMKLLHIDYISVQYVVIYRFFYLIITYLLLALIIIILKNKKIGKKQIFNFIIILLLITLVVVYLCISTGFVEVFVRLFIRKETLETASGRTTIWKNGLNIVLDRNILTGVGRFKAIEINQREYDSTLNQFHNMYIEIFVSFGISGLIIFLTFLIAVLKSIKRSNCDYKNILVATVVCFWILGFFESFCKFSAGYVDTICTIYLFAIPLLLSRTN